MIIRDMEYNIQFGFIGTKAAKSRLKTGNRLLPVLPHGSSTENISIIKIKIKGSKNRSSFNREKGIGFIQKKGMKVYAPTPAEKDMFKQLSQKPVIEFLKKDFRKKGVDLKWFDKFTAAVDNAERALGYK